MVLDQPRFGGSAKTREKSVNEDVARITSENFKLTKRLGELQERLRANNLNAEDVASVAPTSVFKKIAQRKMDRENKVKLMFSQPIHVAPTGFVDASFKDKKVDEWAESKLKAAQKAMSSDDIEATRGQMAQLSYQIEQEKQKRLEIEKELQDLHES